MHVCLYMYVYGDMSADLVYKISPSTFWYQQYVRSQTELSNETSFVLVKSQTFMKINPLTTKQRGWLQNWWFKHDHALRAEYGVHNRPTNQDMYGKNFKATWKDYPLQILWGLGIIVLLIPSQKPERVYFSNVLKSWDYLAALFALGHTSTVI